MPRVTTKGQVTIPKAVRDELGIEPGDVVSFEETELGYTIRKEAPTTMDGDDPFETYRGSAEVEETMPERMRRLRGEYPRGSAMTAPSRSVTPRPSHDYGDRHEHAPGAPLRRRRAR